VRRNRLILSLATVAIGVLVAALGFRMGFERSLLLAPVIVATVGATLFVLALWLKVVIESLREHDHPVRVVSITGAALALLVVLSFFVELPGRGGH
jgi:hypothetical protein